MGSSKEEVVAELWAQFKDGLNDAGRTTLRDEGRLDRFMDPAVTGLGGPNPQNCESARLAVNALPKADDSDAEPCRARGLYGPPELVPLKRVDEVRSRPGLPNTFDLG